MSERPIELPGSIMPGTLQAQWYQDAVRAVRRAAAATDSDGFTRVRFPFRCDVCGTGFSTKWALAMHLKRGCPR